MLKISISGTYASSQTFMPFTGSSFISDCLLQPTRTSIIYCFSSLTSRILFLALLHCFPHFIVKRFRFELLRRHCRMNSKSHIQYAIGVWHAIGSSCNFEVSQDSVETILRWDGKSW